MNTEAAMSDERKVCRCGAEESNRVHHGTREEFGGHTYEPAAEPEGYLVKQDYILDEGAL